MPAGKGRERAGRERRNEGEVPKVGLGREYFSQTGRSFARCIRPYNLPTRFCKFLVTRGAISGIYASMYLTPLLSHIHIRQARRIYLSEAFTFDEQRNRRYLQMGGYRCIAAKRRIHARLYSFSCGAFTRTIVCTYIRMLLSVFL